MKLLATDLDRTLLPNGPAELSPGAMDAFIEQYTKTDSVQLAYVTGRNLRQVKDAQKEFGIPLPDFLLAEVGTKIFYKKDSVLVEDSSWDAYVLEQCPLWNVQSIVSVLKDLSLELQPEEFQNQFKISFFVHEDIQDAVVSLLQGTYDEEIIYSYDPLAKKGLLDIVPKVATKANALKYLLSKHSFEDVIFCGDSGNDILPMFSFKSVVVKNADDQLREALQKHASEITHEIYFAQGFESFNGNYVAGVLEGAKHFGFFK